MANCRRTTSKAKVAVTQPPSLPSDPYILPIPAHPVIMEYAGVTWPVAHDPQARSLTLPISNTLHLPIETQTVQISASIVMSDQRVTSLTTEGRPGEAPHTRRPLQQSLAEGPTSARTLRRNPPPTQGIFATPENDAFYKLYSYSNLDSTQQDIRLIHVFKDEHCNPSKTKPILLQGIKFNVFANLNHALENTLAAWKSNYGGKCILWVDQICINQKRDAERSHQVGFMRDIYSYSLGTFISLSTADKDNTVPNGLSWLKELEEAHQSCWWANKDRFPKFDKSGPPYSITEHIVRQNLSDPTFMKGWASFYDLVQSPWWRRAWIHQEFICSFDVIFMYHDSTISYEDTSFLLFFCQVLQDLQIDNYLFRFIARTREKTGVTRGEGERLMEVCKRNKCAIDSLKAIQLLLNSRKTWRGDEDLKKILVGARHCRSSDPRDRVFAFLGLAHPGYGIKPNYSKSNTLDATLIHTAKKILEFDLHLEMLAFAIRVTKRRARTLPSWVPDWASTKILDDGNFAPLQGSDEDFRYDAIRLSAIHVSIRGNYAVLSVQGLQIDTLDQHLQRGSPPFYDWEFATAQGHSVRCRSVAQQGDELWMIMGSKWPLILRRCDRGYMVRDEKRLRKSAHHRPVLNQVSGTSQNPYLTPSTQCAAQLSRFCNSLHQQPTTEMDHNISTTA
ncbi:hypothetical protein MRS44_015651 [Fusarium solani]|uniref:uncharacterized protein n=1 Tax=Fusarium solani TaxID=169388 RepID=UPI0032C3FCC3|nr:hypothetical protein MRS44_015651 [Fusarium solani]